MTISELNKRFQMREVTPLDCLNTFLKNIEERNPKLNAVYAIYGAEAVQAAKESTERFAKNEPLSLIDGIVFGVKANISIAKKACHGGIKAYDTCVASQDAMLVKKLREAGAIVLASLNMDEGAFGASGKNIWYGDCESPIKLGYTPGGSSSGPAVSVKSGLVQFAIGTDTLGSVRIPASYCGVFGYKPSTGCYSNDGIMPLSPTLDTPGIIANHLDDIVTVHSILMQDEVGSPQCNQERKLKIAFGLIDIAEKDVEPEIWDAYNSLAKRLPRDAQLLKIPSLQLYHFRKAALLIAEAEAAEYHEQKLSSDEHEFGDEFKKILNYGLSIPDDRLQKSYQEKASANGVFETIFADVDIIIMPTTPQVAFKQGEAIPVNQSIFTVIANLIGGAAISIPWGVDSQGLPIGIQFLAKRNDDELLLTVANDFIRRNLASANG